MATVTIACCNQGGLIIGQDEWNNPIILNGPPAPANGLNLGNIAGAGFTEVDADLYASWAAGPGAALVASTAVWRAS